MSKLWVVSLVLCLLPMLGEAQVSIGLQGGPSVVNYYTIEGTSLWIDNGSPGLAAHLRVTCGYQFTSSLSLQSGIGISQRGIDATTHLTRPPYQIGGPLAESRILRRENELTLPLMVRFETGAQWKVFVEGGSYVDILLQTVQRTRGGEEVGTPPSTLRNNDVSGFDLGIALGVGLRRDLSERLALRLGLQHHQGLLDQETQAPDVVYRSHATILAVGVAYQL